MRNASVVFQNIGFFFLPVFLMEFVFSEVSFPYWKSPSLCFDDDGI